MNNLEEYKNLPEIIKDKNKKCLNCKHSFFSDMYLECKKGGIVDYNQVCRKWEKKQ